MVDERAWLLTRTERGNPDTDIDPPDGDVAWSTGNRTLAHIDGASYFEALHRVLEATRAGDLVLFTDWMGDADLRLTGEPGSEVVEVIGRAEQRGVDVRGLVWRSHTDQAGFFAKNNRHLGEQLSRRGAEVSLDMRVRPGGSHHQKFVVVRHADDPSRDVAFVGGIDLARNRRDDQHHEGDPQARPLTAEYGERAPWHDVQLELRGPVVRDVETTFRERWDDPALLTRAPWRRVADAVRRVETDPSRLPAQRPAPPPVGGVTVQLLRAYPHLGPGRGYAFARQGERSVARGYTKAIRQAQELIYVEDQFFWSHRTQHNVPWRRRSDDNEPRGNDVVAALEQQLLARPGLRVVVVVPRHPDKDGLNRAAQRLARHRALARLYDVAPGRVAAYSIENRAGVPVYVHAKVCIIDDTWATTGSDNFNRRSWTHDSELTAAVLDPTHAATLRLRLAAEHLGRLRTRPASGADGTEDALATDELDEVADCKSAEGMFEAFVQHAERLDAWHAGGRVGERPPGHLRTLPFQQPPRRVRPLARFLLAAVHDPDGRPRQMRREHSY
ncbi:phospholipase [Nocardioides sp. ChNu-153]|uniref:phospholipase D family protein n=1 Tax=Nocardioides sp. ChNu-153 TaxID=2779364 RepID=UPI00264DCB83|nr:phospholipase D family protein [Nocardioides sp. ChNu-153]MDN7121489.1 phospholipase [Nocardioides sp. ChNu-153]